MSRAAEPGGRAGPGQSPRMEAKLARYLQAGRQAGRHAGRQAGRPTSTKPLARAVEERLQAGCSSERMSPSRVFDATPILAPPARVSRLNSSTRALVVAGGSRSQSAPSFGGAESDDMGGVTWPPQPVRERSDSPTCSPWRRHLCFDRLGHRGHQPGWITLRRRCRSPWASSASVDAHSTGRFPRATGSAGRARA